MEQINLFVPQSADWSKDLSFTHQDGTPVDITGYEFTSSFRHSYYAANVAGNISITITNAVAGNTLMMLSGDMTTNVIPKTYVYDVYMKDNLNTVTRILEGNFTITPSVTFP